MKEFDYEKDMQIDPDALDIEWLAQAELARKYARYLSQLRTQVKKTTERKKTKRSELILRVNSNPKGCCHKEKPNAADIEAYYRSHEEYTEIIEELLVQEEELEYSELAQKEIAWTRKAALENLVVLHGQQYFAGPKIPRDLRKEWEIKSKQKKTDTTIAKKMKRKEG